jgi:hypothetical protein
MPNEQESRWRQEFEQFGYEAVKNTVFGACMFDEPKRQFAFRWLAEKEAAFEHREQQIQQDTRLMLWIAIGAIGLAILSLVVALLK